MCTNIVEQARVSGCGKAASGWIAVDCAYVTYDHPFHLDLEHALNIDFVNEASGSEERVAVELSLQSARNLARAILAAVDQAEFYERGEERVTAVAAMARREAAL